MCLKGYVRWFPNRFPLSYFLFCFSVSHSFAAGDGIRAQLGSFGQTTGSLSPSTAPGNRVHIRQKQLSLVRGKGQRQRWGYCHLTATLQILLKDFVLDPTAWAARPGLCATHHHHHSSYLLCGRLFLVHGFHRSVFRWCHHVKVVLRNKM